MPNLQASPRNDSLGFIADKLKSGKSYGNKYEILKQIPLLGGTGLGDLFLGNSPELTDDMSYNLSSAIRGGNRATGGLGTYTLDKRSADLGMTLADALGIGTGITKLGAKGLNSLLNKSGFDASRRAFLEGKTSALNKPTNETVTSTLSPIDEILKTPVSRRNVLKGAAVAGGVAVAPSVLRNFSKDVEHVAPKVAETLQNKHIYNSLGEYFADIDHYAHVTDELGHLSPQEKIRHRLKSDEQLYTSMKQGKAEGFTPDYIRNVIDAFSPKAKQEMAEYKNHANSYWSNEALGKDSWTQPRNFEDWLNGDRIPF